jgi:hypothetical protein
MLEFVATMPSKPLGAWVVVVLDMSLFRSFRVNFRRHAASGTQNHATFCYTPKMADFPSTLVSVLFKRCVAAFAGDFGGSAFFSLSRFRAQATCTMKFYSSKPASSRATGLPHTQQSIRIYSRHSSTLGVQKQRVNTGSRISGVRVSLQH